MNYYTKTSWNISNDFKLSKASEEVIKIILLSFNIGKAAGMDRIPTKFLREGVEVLALPLRNIINSSIKLLRQCKIATLKLIFKKGARADTKNYRPISLLPLLSKISEESIHFQIEYYLNKKKLI